MDAVIGGRSAIDLPRLEVADAAQARAFLLRYGYDINDPHHASVVERIRAEAIGFIRGVLLGEHDLVVPEWLDEVSIIDLLLEAAVGTVTPDSGARLRQAWACALLRVMHTFAHAENYFQHAYYPQIREAILERFVAQVDTAEDGSQVLRGRRGGVPLVRFEVKEVKPLRSVVLKLLHKAENVATDLFDHIGVRIIVERPVDAIFAVRTLLETHTIMFANIKPTRSRNTLLDLASLREHINRVADAIDGGQMTVDQVHEALAGFEVRPSEHIDLPVNRHSSTRYRSIQFTCRQMIRIANPLWQRLHGTRNLLKDRGVVIDAELGSALDLFGVERQIQFFFPYEVQVMDRESYEEAVRGRASYREYKRRQVESVRHRVLGQVMSLQAESRRQPSRRRRDSVSLPTLRELLGVR